MCVCVCVCVPVCVCVCVCVCARALSCFSRVWLFVILWTIVHQALLSLEFSSKNTGVGYHFLLQGIFSTQGSKLHLLRLLYFRQILYHWATWEACTCTHLNSNSLRRIAIHLCYWQLTAWWGGPESPLPCEHSSLRGRIHSEMPVLGTWIQVQIPALSPTSCGTLGTSLNLSVSQSSPSVNGNNISFLLGLLWSWKEVLTYSEWWKQHLANAV